METIITKSIPFHEESIPGRHTVIYRTRDGHRGFPVRKVEVLATPEEIQTFVRDGYLVRERLIPMEQVERLRAALDEAVARDEHLEKGGGKAFGGVFIRHLMDKHPTFPGSGFGQGLPLDRSLPLQPVQDRLALWRLDKRDLGRDAGAPWETGRA